MTLSRCPLSILFSCGTPPSRNPESVIRCNKQSPPLSGRIYTETHPKGTYTSNPL